MRENIQTPIAKNSVVRRSELKAGKLPDVPDRKVRTGTHDAVGKLAVLLAVPRAPDRPDPLGVRSHEVHRTVVNKDRVGGRNAPAPARHQKHQATRLRTPLAQRMHVSAGHQAVHNMVKLQRFKHGPGIVATLRPGSLFTSSAGHPLNWM